MRSARGPRRFCDGSTGRLERLRLVLAVLVFVGYHMSARTAPYATKTVISFLVGAICSALAGYTGMYCSIRANIRTASAARTSLNKALQMALRGGAVTGLVVVALSLLGVGSLFLFFGGLEHPQAVPYQLVGFGFGASLVALFAQLGGGIYTKAADVGADLVGKVEAGIPEDDPRNPAVIADLVGDNVGDCAGRGADIFESTAAENVGAMILGAALYPVFGVKGILFPLIVLAINLIASLVGVFVVSTTEDEDPMHALNRGFYVTSGLALLGFAGAVYLMLDGPLVKPMWLLGCGVDRVDYFVPVCVDYGVLHGVPLQAGAVDCGGFADGAGDEHYQRAGCGDGDAGDAGDCDLGGAAAELLLRRAGTGWTLRGSPTTRRGFMGRRLPRWGC